METTAVTAVTTLVITMEIIILFAIVASAMYIDLKIRAVQNHAIDIKNLLVTMIDAEKARFAGQAGKNTTTRGDDEIENIISTFK